MKCLFSLFLIVGLLSCSEESPKDKLSSFLKAKLLKYENYTAMPNRPRHRLLLVNTEIDDPEKHIPNAIVAAYLLQRATKAGQIMVIIGPDKKLTYQGLDLVQVVFTPDGKGNSGRDNSPIWSIIVPGFNVTRDRIKYQIAWIEATKVVDEDLDDSHRFKYVKSITGFSDEQIKQLSDEYINKTILYGPGKKQISADGYSELLSQLPKWVDQMEKNELLSILGLKVTE